MIVFYGSDFELNVTNFNIKFIEESAFFFKSFFKNYTLPFTMPLDDETSIKLGLIDVSNISNYKVKHEGKLLIDTKFYDAFFILEIRNEELEGSFFFGKENLPVLEKSLKEIPFPTITTSNMNSLINSYIDKSWPEVPCNFPMVYDDDFSKTTNYDAFEGVVNKRVGGALVYNTLDVDDNLLNKNIVTPFPYILEILKRGFLSENRSLVGGFVNKKENAHLLLDSKLHLEKFSSTTSQDIQFKTHTDQYLDNGVFISEFKDESLITTSGTYNIKISINLPSDIIVTSFQLVQDTTVIFESTSRAIQKDLAINIENFTSNVNVYYILKLEGNVGSIEDYNNISFEKGEGKLNVFKNTFSLAEIVPDMTFGGFLEKLKNWLNLKFTIQNSYVKIDYVEELFDVVDFKDETQFEIKTPRIEFNQTKRFQLTTEYPYSEIIVDKTGLNTNIYDIRKEDITTIETGVSIYPIEERNSIFTAVRNKEAKFGILLYNGKDANNNAVVTSNVEGKSFSLQEIYTKYWAKWLYFRLNSETYKDKFTAHSLEDFSTLVGRFKYNKKHLIKKITKSRISEEHYLYEIESETL